MSIKPKPDLKERIQKLEHTLAQPVESTGSLYWPRELEDPEFDYRAINNDFEIPFEMHQSYKLGWENLGIEEAERFREHMGQGIFSAGSKGDGGIVEIPVGNNIAARIVKRHKALSDIVEEAYKKKIDKIQASLGYDLQYDVNPNNSILQSSVEVNRGVVK